MSKRKNLNNVDLSFHLQHPGKGREPGDPNAIFYLNGVYHLHYILRHKWNGVRKNLPRSNFPYNHSHSFIHCTSKIGNGKKLNYNQALQDMVCLVELDLLL